MLVVRDLVGIVGGACTAFAQEQVTGVEQVFITAGDRANGVQNKGRDIKQLFVIFHRLVKCFQPEMPMASAPGRCRLPPAGRAASYPHGWAGSAARRVKHARPARDTGFGLLVQVLIAQHKVSSAIGIQHQKSLFKRVK